MDEVTVVIETFRILGFAISIVLLVEIFIWLAWWIVIKYFIDW